MGQGTPLGGIDVFHLVGDRVMRSRGLPGNHCLFVLELDGRLDRAALERRLGRAVELCPELCWRLRGGWPIAPRWVPDVGRAAPPVRVFEIASRAALPPAIDACLATRRSGDSPWAIDLVRMPDRDVVVLSWFHSLVDSKGAERLVRWLGSGSGDEPEAPPPAAERFETSDRLIAKLDDAARLAAMRAYNTHMMGLGARPVLSLAKVHRGRPLGATRTLRIHFSEDATRAFDRRVRERAKLAETSVMLRAAARALDGALLRRGFAPVQHVVPVPLSLDPKAGATRLFGNHLTMMSLALDRDDLADEARAIARLAEQQREVVRKKLDVGMIAAASFAKKLPWPLYDVLMRHPLGGEIGSLVFSNPGAVTLTSFAGRAVVDAHPLPAVVAPPGFQVIMTRFGGRLSAMVSYLDGLVGSEESARIGRDLEALLLGGP